MLVQSIENGSQSAHVVVLGNEKGGSGKSTTALHIAVALLKAGQRVATIDLDSRQKSFTHYIENRRDWAARAGLKLALPTHFCIDRAESLSVESNEAQEFAAFSRAIGIIERNHDVVVIDTPGHDSYLMRLAHSMADTLVSLTDWIVVRNRLSQLGSRNKKLVGEGINELSRRMGFRCIDGFAERVVYREFFPRGLTALDDLDETTLGTRPNMSHVTAREEVIALLNALHLPLSENGRRRAAARAEWYSVMDQPLAVHDVLA